MLYTHIYMKNIILKSIIILFICGQSIHVFSEEKPEHCSMNTIEVYIDDPDTSGTNIRKSPGGEVIMKIDNNKNSHWMDLTESRNGWFKIQGPIWSTAENIELPSGEAWIHGSVISIDTRNYGQQPLELLSKPVDGVPVYKFVEEIGLELKDFCGEWAKVSHEGKTGWIESNWLCGHPLTLCN